MPDEFWLNMTAGLVDTFGYPSEAILVIFAFLISMGISIFVIAELKQHGHSKEIGVAVFFLSLGTMALLGIISWIIVAVPLFLIAMFMVQARKSEG